MKTTGRAEDQPTGPHLARDSRWWLAAMVLVFAVAAIYGQTARHSFTSFDDDVYILSNPEVTGGLTWSGFVWAFGYHAANWHPLTWLSHMLDAQVFGLWAGGHHLVNAGIHALNAILVLLLLRSLTGGFWRSAAVAAIFAVHPLRVESVAWAAERKDVLSAAFWLLTTLAYAWYARRPSWRRSVSVVALFTLGLMAKPMLVTLPFTLLLLDAWPLGRARGGGQVAATPWTRLALEKVPLFLLSFASSVVTFYGQSTGVIKTVEADLPSRLANAVVSYAAYLGSFAWPLRLAPLYPFPRGGAPPGVTAAALLALGVLSAAAWFWRRRAPYALVGWLWYLGTLLPVIGIVHVGGQARADRYTYLPLLGVAVALTWLIASAWPRRAPARIALAGLLGALLIALTGAAAIQTARWKDDLSLYSYATRMTQDNFLMLNNFGSALLEAKRYAEATAVLEQAIRVNPDHCNAHYNLGRASLSAGKYRESLVASERALNCYVAGGHRVDYVADTLLNLGHAAARLGMDLVAERYLLEFLRILPGHPGATSLLTAVRAHRAKWSGTAAARQGASPARGSGTTSP